MRLALELSIQQSHYGIVTLDLPGVQLNLLVDKQLLNIIWIIKWFFLLLMLFINSIGGLL